MSGEEQIPLSSSSADTVRSPTVKTMETNVLKALAEGLVEMKKIRDDQTADQMGFMLAHFEELAKVDAALKQTILDAQAAAAAATKKSEQKVFTFPAIRPSHLPNPLVWKSFNYCIRELLKHFQFFFQFTKFASHVDDQFQKLNARLTGDPEPESPGCRRLRLLKEEVAALEGRKNM
jgi:hypothetical protein